MVQWYSTLALTVILSARAQVRLPLTTSGAFQLILTNHLINHEHDTVTAKQQNVGERRENFKHADVEQCEEYDFHCKPGE